jgi:AcrR family transcriptional regulator
MPSKPNKRAPLTRERVLQAALRFADRHGLEALTMRKLANDLGVEAMSLYNHVENKEDLVAGILDLVVAEVDPPSEELDWKPALRERALAVRAAFARHPWAARVWMSASTPSPDRFAHADAVLRCLRKAGLSPVVTSHAYHVIDGYTLGYTLQQLDLPYDRQQLKQVAGDILHDFPVDTYPDLAQHIRQHLEHDETEPGSFEFGFDLILDGLERLRYPA